MAAWISGSAWLLLQVLGQTSTATVGTTAPSPNAPSRVRLGLELRELLNPGAEGGGVLLLQTLAAGAAFDLVPERLRLELAVPLAVASNLDPGRGSTQLFLGNPGAMLWGTLRSGLFAGSLGLGMNLPLAGLGVHGAPLFAGAASAHGGADAPRWAGDFTALFGAELALEGDRWRAALRLSTAFAVQSPKPGGDVLAELLYNLNPSISLGAQVGLARYQLPPPESDRVVRLCIADDPRLCPGGPPPAHFELDGAVLRVEPFVVLHLGPEVRIAWTVLAASDEPVEQLYGRHELTASVWLGF